MKYCGSCGEKIIGKGVYCNKCGEKTNNKSKNKINKEDITSKIEDILDTKNSTKSFTKKDIENNKKLAVLSYLSILALIPYFAHQDSKYVKFHAKQGMNLLLVWIIYYIFYRLVSSFKINSNCIFQGIVNYCQVTPWWISFPLNLLGIAIFALALIGIINVIQGKAKELPLIGNIKLF